MKYSNILLLSIAFICIIGCTLATQLTPAFQAGPVNGYALLSFAITESDLSPQSLTFSSPAPIAPAACFSAASFTYHDAAVFSLPYYSDNVQYSVLECHVDALKVGTLNVGCPNDTPSTIELTTTVAVTNGKTITCALPVLAVLAETAFSLAAPSTTDGVKSTDITVKITDAPQITVGGISIPKLNPQAYNPVTFTISSATGGVSYPIQAVVSSVRASDNTWQIRSRVNFSYLDETALTDSYHCSDNKSRFIVKNGQNTAYLYIASDVTSNITCTLSLQTEFFSLWHLNRQSVNSDYEISTAEGRFLINSVLDSKDMIYDLSIGDIDSEWLRISSNVEYDDAAGVGIITLTVTNPGPAYGLVPFCSYQNSAQGCMTQLTLKFSPEDDAEDISHFMSHLTWDDTTVTTATIDTKEGYIRYNILNTSRDLVATFNISEMHDISIYSIVASIRQFMGGEVIYEEGVDTFPHVFGVTPHVVVTTDPIEVDVNETRARFSSVSTIKPVSGLYLEKGQKIPLLLKVEVNMPISSFECHYNINGGKSQEFQEVVQPVSYFVDYHYYGFRTDSLRTKSDYIQIDCVYDITPAQLAAIGKSFVSGTDIKQNIQIGLSSTTTVVLDDSFYDDESISAWFTTSPAIVTATSHDLAVENNTQYYAAIQRIVDVLSAAVVPTGKVNCIKGKDIKTLFYFLAQQVDYSDNGASVADITPGFNISTIRDWNESLILAINPSVFTDADVNCADYKDYDVSGVVSDITLVWDFTQTSYKIPIASSSNFESSPYRAALGQKCTTDFDCSTHGQELFCSSARCQARSRASDNMFTSIIRNADQYSLENLTDSASIYYYTLAFVMTILAVVVLV